MGMHSVGRVWRSELTLLSTVLFVFFFLGFLNQFVGFVIDARPVIFIIHCINILTSSHNLETIYYTKIC